MGRSCLVCGCSRPNESFGGKGQRRLVCKKCRAKGKDYVSSCLASGAIYDYWDQKNISKKNIKHLNELEKHDSHEVSVLARAVKQVALIAPGRKKRYLRIYHDHPKLFEECVRLNLLEPYEERDEYAGLIDYRLNDLTEDEDCISEDDLPF